MAAVLPEWRDSGGYGGINLARYRDSWNRLSKSGKKLTDKS